MTLRNVPNTFTLEQQRQELNAIAIDLDDAVDGIQTFSGDKTFSDNVTFSDDVTFQAQTFWGDGDQAVFGDDSDFKIYYDGAVGVQTSFIDSDALIIRSESDSDEKYITALKDGSVELYHNGTKKIATSLTGATVLGDLFASTLTGDLLDSNADTMIDVSEGNIYANTVYATGLGSNTTGQIITSYLVASSGMSYDATDPTNGIFLTPGSDLVAAVFTGNVTGDVNGDVLDSNANVMVDISQGAVYADKVWATGLGSNATGEVVTSYLVVSEGMSYDASDPTNGIFLTPGSAGVAPVFTGNVTGSVTGDTAGTHSGTNIGQQHGDVYTADGGTQVVDTAAAPSPIFRGDAEGLTGSPNIACGNIFTGDFADSGSTSTGAGVRVGSSGQISLSRSLDTSPLLKGYTSAGGPSFAINGDGSGAFAGTIQSTTFNAGFASGSGYELYNDSSLARISVQAYWNLANDTVIFNGHHGSNTTSSITADGSASFSGDLEVIGKTDIRQVVETVVNNFTSTLSPTGGVLSIDTSLGTVVLGQLNASVSRWAFLNVPTENGKATTVTLIVENTDPYTYADDCDVNGTSITGGVKWAGGSRPTATNDIDVITFTIVRDGIGTVNVLGSYTTNFT